MKEEKNKIKAQEEALEQLFQGSDPKDKIVMDAIM